MFRCALRCLLASPTITCIETLLAIPDPAFRRLRFRSRAVPALLTGKAPVKFKKAHIAIVADPGNTARPGSRNPRCP